MKSKCGIFNFSNKRIYNNSPKQRNLHNLNISSMDSDLMRISSCAAFRRLQDKTQLFPLAENDYSRTRLTHSIEVALTAKSITFLINREIDAINSRDRTSYNHLLKDAIEAACYLHDIGNPPFGHYGETIISQYFIQNWDSLLVNYDGKKVGLASIISKNDREYFDFSRFDGNAQALRVVTKLESLKVLDNPGLNLTSAVLGSLIKYPFESDYCISSNKFGFFYSEDDVISFLKNQGDFYDNCIHPGALIMEAADDICMFVSDFEDSIKRGKINAEDIIKFRTRKKMTVDFKRKFQSFYEQNKGITDDDLVLLSIKPLLNETKNLLIKECASTFANNISLIALGCKNYKREINNRNKTLKHKCLIEECEHYSIVEMSKCLLNKKVYCDDEIVSPELKGEFILNKLLELFTESILSLSFDEICFNGFKTKEFKIVNLFSKSFLNAYIDKIRNLKLNNKYNIKEDVYYRLRLVVDQISGMTDNYAVELYNKIFN